MLAARVTWTRLTADLRADYALTYHCGQVRNGGHSQFTGNARNPYPVKDLAALRSRLGKLDGETNRWL